MTKKQFDADIKKYVSKPISKEIIERTLVEISKSEWLSNSTLKNELVKDVIKMEAIHE